MSGRVLFHVDMNSYYASVEAADDPSVRGRPLVIAGSAKKRKGIVVTASYEARRAGVKPPQPLWEAKKACPNLLVREPRFDRYREKSEALFDYLRSCSPLVEKVSIDEGYVDVTGHEAPYTLAVQMQQDIKEQLGLPCSIGIAPNKFLAKMASDMKKPEGITVLRRRELHLHLWPLEIEEMHGVGAKTGEKLRSAGIDTIGLLAQTESEVLRQLLGSNGLKLHERANGKDDRPVDPDAADEFKSIGHSRTLPEDAVSWQDVAETMHYMAGLVEDRCRKKNVYAEGIQLTIRYRSFQTIQRSKRLQKPLREQSALFEAAKELWEEAWSGEPVRLVGITAIDPVEQGTAYEQLNLFDWEKDAEKWKTDALIQRINEDYGRGSLQKGRYFRGRD